MLYNIAMKTYRYIIKGIVQGVAFRYYTAKNAGRFSIKGTVKNLYNGDVEVVAQGDPENIKNFEIFLRSGPAAAVVDQLIKEKIFIDEVYTGFEIIY
jgi:acylphosphatase